MQWCFAFEIYWTLYLHSMARANLNKVENFIINITTAYLNMPFQTPYHLVKMIAKCAFLKYYFSNKNKILQVYALEFERGGLWNSWACTLMLRQYLSWNFHHLRLALAILCFLFPPITAKQHGRADLWLVERRIIFGHLHFGFLIWILL